MARVLQKSSWLLKVWQSFIEFEQEKEEEDERFEYGTQLVHWPREDQDLQSTQSNNNEGDREIVVSDFQYYIPCTVKREAIEHFCKKNWRCQDHFDRLRGSILQLKEFEFVKVDDHYELVVYRFDSLVKDKFNHSEGLRDLNEEISEQIRRVQQKQNAPAAIDLNQQDFFDQSDENDCKISDSQLLELNSLYINGFTPDDGTVEEQVNDYPFVQKSNPQKLECSKDDQNESCFAFRSLVLDDSKSKIQTNEYELDVNNYREHLDKYQYSDSISPQLILDSSSDSNPAELDNGVSDAFKMEEENVSKMICTSNDNNIKFVSKHSPEAQEQERLQSYTVIRGLELQTQIATQTESIDDEAMLNLLIGEESQGQIASINTSPDKNIGETENKHLGNTSTVVVEKQTNTQIHKNYSIDIEAWNKILNMWMTE
jgi:hypothetical protein